MRHSLLFIVFFLLTNVWAAATFAAGSNIASPQIWFGAEPPVPLGSSNPTGGAVDYADWLSSTAGWERSSRVIDVVIINAAWIEKVASDNQLRRAIQTLASRNIKIALELNGLRASAECSGDGFASRDPAIPVRKILAVGGNVDYVILNEPYAWGSVGHGEHACHWPPEKLANELKPFLDALHQLVPKVEIGDAEPLWTNITGRQLVNWTDTFAAVTGAQFRFFHMDFDYKGRAADWVQEAALVRVQMRQRHIAFGTYIFGNRSDASDRGWLESAYQRGEQLDTGGAKPDHIVVQSWHPLPRHILPESSPDSFMSLILRYANAHGENSK
jgi:hypothetical protein